MNQRLFIVTLLVVFLVIGVTISVVMAQENGTDEGSNPTSFASRVARILGVPETEVQGAFQQANREIQNEAELSRLDRKVARGRLTQEQADEYYAWYQARPAGFSARGHLPDFRRGEFNQRSKWGGHRRSGRRSRYQSPAPEGTEPSSP